MAPLWGFLSDRYGRKIMMMRATVSAMIVLTLMGFAQTVQSVALLRLVQGFFTGTITAAAILVAANTPKERLSYALGFLASSQFIGMSLGPAAGGLLAESFGYRNTFFAAAFLLGICSLSVLLFIDEKTPRAHAKRKKGMRQNIAAYLGGALVAAAVGTILLKAISLFISPFIALYIKSILGTERNASLSTGIILGLRGVVIAVASLTLVRLGDRYDKLHLINRMLVAAFIFAAPLFLTRGLPDFTVCYVLSGFFLGSVEPVLQSFVSSRIPADRRGVSLGILTSAGHVGNGIAPLASSFLAMHAGIRSIFIGHALLILIACFFFFFYRLRVKQTAGKTGKGAPIPLDDHSTG
jgi:DHA1 family multidrug resistance protein-like MFS transporter